MTRLLSTIKADVSIQLRNNLYAVGAASGIIAAAVLSQLAGPDNLSLAIPATVLLVTGGMAMLYVMGLIIFEKDQGTLNAIIVSPLRISEYLGSKIVTLAALALFETLITVGGAMLVIGRSHEVVAPRVPILLVGILAIGVIYTLVGIILVVRYDKITTALIPMGAIGAVLQAPALHFLGWIEHPAFLFIPTSAPTMLMRGAYVPLETSEWAYAIATTVVIVAGLGLWAYRAFNTHVVMRAG